MPRLTRCQWSPRLLLPNDRTSAIPVWTRAARSAWKDTSTTLSFVPLTTPNKRKNSSSSSTPTAMSATLSVSIARLCKVLQGLKKMPPAPLRHFLDTPSKERAAWLDGLHRVQVPVADEALRLECFCQVVFGKPAVASPRMLTHNPLAKLDVLDMILAHAISTSNHALIEDVCNAPFAGNGEAPWATAVLLAAMTASEAVFLHCITIYGGWITAVLPQAIELDARFMPESVLHLATSLYPDLVVRPDNAVTLRALGLIDSDHPHLSGIVDTANMREGLTSAVSDVADFMNIIKRDPDCGVAHALKAWVSTARSTQSMTILQPLVAKMAGLERDAAVNTS